MNEIIRASGALNVPDEILQLAEKLKDIHGVVSIHKEANGIHLHLPDPELLSQDGRKEFGSRHLTINAELYLGIGKYDVDTHPTSENRKIWGGIPQQGQGGSMLKVSQDRQAVLRFTAPYDATCR